MTHTSCGTESDVQRPEWEEVGSGRNVGAGQKSCTRNMTSSAGMTERGLEVQALCVTLASMRSTKHSRSANCRGLQR